MCYVGRVQSQTVVLTRSIRYMRFAASVIRPWLMIELTLPHYSAELCTLVKAQHICWVIGLCSTIKDSGFVVECRRLAPYVSGSNTVMCGLVSGILPPKRCEYCLSLHEALHTCWVIDLCSTIKDSGSVVECRRLAPYVSGSNTIMSGFGLCDFSTQTTRVLVKSPWIRHRD